MFTDLLESCLAASDAELDARVRALELAGRAIEAERAAVLATIQARGMFRADGHRTIGGFVRATVNTSSRDASRRVLVATVCDLVPVLGDALLAGRVGVVQVLEIARIHTNPRTRGFFARVAPIYVDRAERVSYQELAADVSQFLVLADQDGSFVDVCDSIEHRHASAHVVGGTVDVTMQGGDAVQAAEVAATLDWFCDREFAADVAARRAEHGDRADEFPLSRTDRQRRFDAMLAIFRAATAHGDGNGVPAKIVINLVADPHTLNDAFADAGLIPTRHTPTSRDDTGVDDFDADVDAPLPGSDDDDGTPRAEFDPTGSPVPAPQPAGSGSVVPGSSMETPGSSGAGFDPTGSPQPTGTAPVVPGWPVDWPVSAMDETFEDVELADHLVDDLLADAAGDPARWIGRRCRTSTGIEIHPVLLARAALEAYIRRVVIDTDGVVVDAGRDQRLFTGPARDVAMLLTPWCSHPGCTIVCTHADIDHMIEWHQDGRTDQDNADIVCRTHNRFKHRQRWRSLPDRHGRTYRIRPDGTIVLPVGARQPDLSINQQRAIVRRRLAELTRPD